MRFDPEQLDRIACDIREPRNGIVFDEYVEFILWTKGLKSRQEYFADFIERIFSRERYRKLLEVGAGKHARMSVLLSEKGYEMTAMDPELMPETVESEAVRCIKDCFHYGQTDVTGYDAVVAQEPCEATEHIVRACTAERKDFLISLCGTPHRLMNGEMPADLTEWYEYLQETGGSNCFLIEPQLIPGYVSYVLIGVFR